MANKENVGDHYPLFNQPSKRAHFENPISSDVNTNPDRIELIENFNQLPGANGDIAVAFNLDFEVLGSGSDQGDITYGGAVGGIKMETDSSGEQQEIICPHLNSEQSAWESTLWGTENQVIWEAVIKTGTSIADITIWGGLKLTNDQDITTDADQAFFRFDTTNWEAVSTVGDGGDVEVDTKVALVASTVYYLRIEIDSDRKAHFFINDKEVAISAALTDAVDLKPYVGVEGNEKHIYLVKQKISRVI